MAQTVLDESIEKLERFCNLLGQTRAVMIRDAEILEARGESLERTEAETRERGEHVTERLKTTLQELTEAQAETLEDTDRLGDAAEDLVPDRLSTTEDSLDSSEASFEVSLGRDRADLEGAFLDLCDMGFVVLATMVDEIEAELGRAGQASGDALEGLEGELAEVGRLTVESHTETVAVLESAEHTLREGEAQELEQRLIEHTTLWADELPDAVRAACDAVGDPLETLYREWGAEVVAEGDELAQEIAGLLQGATHVVVSEAGEPLAAAVDETTCECFRDLAGGQETLLSVLADGEPATEAAAALVDDLVLGRQALEEIERTLSALAG